MGEAPGTWEANWGILSKSCSTLSVLVAVAARGVTTNAMSTEPLSADTTHDKLNLMHRFLTQIRDVAANTADAPGPLGAAVPREPDQSMNAEAQLDSTVPDSQASTLALGIHRGWLYWWY